MADMPPTEQLDFLLEHGDRYAILGSGERVQPSGGLPRNAGTHLVGGIAKKGTWKSTDLPPGRIRLDPSYRWLGIASYRKPTLQLFDVLKGLTPAFRYEMPGLKRHFAIHPQGDLVATRQGGNICLHGPDGHLIRSARFRRSRREYADELFEFSACGGYLWLATTPPGDKAVLRLLRCPSLEMADSRPPEQAPWLESHYDTSASWDELSIAVLPAHGHLFIHRRAGDTDIGLDIYGVEGGQVRLLNQDVRRFYDGLMGDLWRLPVFSADGKRLFVNDNGGYFHEYSYPGFGSHTQESDEVVPSDLAEYEDRLMGYAYSGDVVLLAVGQEVRVLRSGDLRLSPYPVAGAASVLPNGFLLVSGYVRNEITEFRVTGRSFPVVAAIDSKSTRATAVYRKARSRWTQIDDVGWLETPFDIRWNDP
jgi:hypothetical protein